MGSESLFGNGFDLIMCCDIFSGIALQGCGGCNGD